MTETKALLASAMSQAKEAIFRQAAGGAAVNWLHPCRTRDDKFVRNAKAFKAALTIPREIRAAVPMGDEGWIISQM
jgi:hypothetical protein